VRCSDSGEFDEDVCPIGRAAAERPIWEPNADPALLPLGVVDFQRARDGSFCGLR